MRENICIAITISIAVVDNGFIVTAYAGNTYKKFVASETLQGYGSDTLASVIALGLKWAKEEAARKQAVIDNLKPVIEETGYDSL